MTLDFKDAPPGVTMKVVCHPTHLELAVLRVADDRQNRGLGTVAVRRLQRLRRPITLTATPDQRKRATLHRFYTRLGFRPVRKNAVGETIFTWTP